MDFDPAQAFNTEFDRGLAEIPEGTDVYVSGRPSKAHPDGEDEAWWRVEGPLMVQRWMEWRTETPWDIWVSPDGVIGIELELTVPIDGVLIKLYVDRVFATADNNARPVILDLKSGRPPDWLFQLGLYKCAIEATWPEVKIAGGCYWMARTGEVTGVENLDAVTPELVGAYMRRLKLARAAGIFLPRISSMCKSCKVGKYCAANRGSEAHMDPDFVLMGGAK